MTENMKTLLGTETAAQAIQDRLAVTCCSEERHRLTNTRCMVSDLPAPPHGARLIKHGPGMYGLYVPCPHAEHLLDMFRSRP